jgi:hypothetical protein
MSTSYDQSICRKAIGGKGPERSIRRPANSPKAPQLRLPRLQPLLRLCKHEDGRRPEPDLPGQPAVAGEAGSSPFAALQVSSAPSDRRWGPTLRPKTEGHNGPSLLRSFNEQGSAIRTLDRQLDRPRTLGRIIIRRILPRAEMEAQRLQQVLDMSGGRDARTRWASRPESRLTGLRSVPHRVSTESRLPADMVRPSARLCVGEDD